MCIRKLSRCECFWESSPFRFQFKYNIYQHTFWTEFRDLQRHWSAIQLAELVYLILLCVKCPIRFQISWESFFLYVLWMVYNEHIIEFIRTYIFTMLNAHAHAVWSPLFSLWLCFAFEVISNFVYVLAEYYAPVSSNPAKCIVHCTCSAKHQEKERDARGPRERGREKERKTEIFWSEKQRPGKNQCACHVTLQNWKISLIFTYDTWASCAHSVSVSVSPLRSPHFSFRIVCHECVPARAHTRILVHSFWE